MLEAEEIQRDRRFEKVHGEAQDTQRKYRRLLKDYEAAQKELSVALDVKAGFKPVRIVAEKGKGATGEATAIALASDWHVGHCIEAKTVNNLNSFNPTIAENRAGNFFKNALKLVRKERQDVKIDTLVLWLGGDLISNYIHPELQEMNFMSPTQEIVFAQNLIGGGLKYLAEHGEFKRIVVPCSTGNHGRSTEKRRVSSEYRNSLEHLLYWNLQAQHTDPIYEWLIPDAYFNYVNIYGALHRFHHGHNVKYGGGIGGLSVPLIRYVNRANSQRNAVHDYLGHFHQWTRHGNFTVNGSLCGFDAYALSIGASPERPQQAFQLVDSKRGMTVSAPILLDE